MAGNEGEPTVRGRPGSKSARANDDAPAGRARYVGVEEIARGGMGRVIEATDTLLARTVAVKEALTDDPDTLRRFARETRITARLEHPSIVPVYDAGTDPSAPFYVMRRVTGKPLSGLIKSAGTLDERLALIPHVLACAQAIAHAHRRGVIHRDIKPSNILVGELGETVVIDWGIAKVIAENDPDDEMPIAGDSLRTVIGTVTGTPGFMSPEQARGDELGTSADVWALGATLYYVLSRQVPHGVHGKTPDELIQLAGTQPVPPIADLVSGIPPELAAITARALAFDAADRFSDAAELAEELSRFSTGQIVASHRYSVRERLVRWVKRHRGVVAIASLAIIVVAIVSAVAIGRVVAARERADASALREQAHAETELLARARAIATTHPTAAIAAIDQLPAGSPRVADANAIFATAISHGGAAWGLARNSGPIAALELDPTASKLLQLTQAGLLQVWDLDRRTVLFERTLAKMEQVVWLARGILVFGPGEPRLLDASTGQVTPFGTVPFQNVIASEDGTRAAAITTTGAAGWLDLATAQMIVLAAEHPFESIAMPDDASWLATYGAGEIVVYDPAGAVILRRATEQPSLHASRSKHLAIVEGDRLFETTVAPGATWQEIPRANVAWPDYLDEALVGRSLGALVVFGGRPKAAVTLATIDGISTTMSPVGSGMLAFASAPTARELVYFDLLRTRRIPLPEAFVSPKLAARRGGTRVAVASSAMILVIDLEHVLPRRRPDLLAQNARFVTNDQVIAMDAAGAWGLHHRADKRVALDSIPVQAEVLEVSGGHVLFGDPPTEIYALDIARMDVWHTRAERGRLLDGGVLYISGKQLYLRRAREPDGRELAELPDPVEIIATDGPRFFVFSERELLRGDVTTGVVERRPYALPKTGALLPLEGRLLVADDKQLHWDTLDGSLIGTVDDTIAGMYRVRGGAMAMLASGPALYVETGATTAIHHLSSTLIANAESGRLVVHSSSGTEIIELPSRRRWVHPIENPVPTKISISPDGTSLLELGADGAWWEWTLPPSGLAIDAIRHTATNAREQDDRVLLWPWQTSSTR